jgi:hypothetical protein
MLMRGTSHFTPRQFGKPLGWDAERSRRAIEELWHTHTIQQTITGDGDIAMSYDRVLNVAVTRAWDTDGNELATYYISALESPFDWWGCPNGEL